MKPTNWFHRILGAACALTLLIGTAYTASATDPTITSDLQTAATTALTAVVATLGVILVAAFAIPVGKKVYRVIKGGIGAAAIAFVALLASQTGAWATDPTITSDLQTAATTALTAVIATLGVILVAAFAIPVGKKVYRVIKGGIGSA